MSIPNLSDRIDSIRMDTLAYKLDATGNAIRAAALKSAKRFLDDKLPALMADVLGENLPDTAPLNRAQFIWATAKHIGKSVASPWPQVLDLARAAVAEAVLDCGGYAHPGYAWDRHAARIVAQEYVLDHAEPV